MIFHEIIDMVDLINVPLGARVGWYFYEIMFFAYCGDLVFFVAIVMFFCESNIRHF